MNIHPVEYAEEGGPYALGNFAPLGIWPIEEISNLHKEGTTEVEKMQDEAHKTQRLGEFVKKFRSGNATKATRPKSPSQVKSTNSTSGNIYMGYR